MDKLKVFRFRACGTRGSVPVAKFGSTSAGVLALISLVAISKTLITCISVWDSIQDSVQEYQSRVAGRLF